MKKTTNRLLLLVLFSIGSMLAYGQEKRDYSGWVRDSTRTPIVGATIIEKNGNAKTFTKDDGLFSIKVPPNAILKISYVGYQTIEVPISSFAKSSTVTLKPNSAEINEVVVTGFGENRAKRNLGYSVTQVSGDDVRRASSVNPIAALQGMVAGLQVTPNVGGPQSSTRFLIRGSASLDPYGNQPLVVIDDIVMDDQVILPNKGGTQDFGNILKDINPDDIESISVLKGGAVTALYGSKASNGVILIKTKKGFSQRGLGVSLSQTLQFETAYKTVDLQNQFGAGVHPNDWNKLANGTLTINPSTYYLSFGPEMTGQTFQDINGLITTNTPGKNDPLSLYGTGVTSNTNVAIAGGNENTTFRMSYSHLNANSATPNNNLGRNSYNFRATHRPIKRVLIDVNTSYTQSNTQNPALQGASSVLYATAYGVPRNYDFNYWKDHYIDTAIGGQNTLDISGADNAFWRIFQNKYQQTENNFRGSVNVRADITDWLRFEGAASLNYFSTYYTSSERGTSTGFTGGNYLESSSATSQNRYRGNFNLTKKLKDFDLLLQVGGELNKSKGNSQSSKTNGLIYPDIYRLSNSANPIVSTEGAPNVKDLSSLFFQGSVGFRNYLTLNVYGRNDWNSTLVYSDGHGNYSYFYPGADVAFVFTDAFKLPKIFNFGKLRFSANKVGGGATLAYQASTAGYTSYGVYQDAYGNSITRFGIQGNSLVNQNLFPISNVKFETGLEFKMFKNRLGGDVTFYQQSSEGQIIPFDVPTTSGVVTATVNGGKVRNQGIELLLYGSPIKTKNFSWDMVFNYTKNKNTILSLPFGAKSKTLDSDDGIYSVGYVGGDYGSIVAPYSKAYYQAKDASGNNVANPNNGMAVVGFNATGGNLGGPIMPYTRASVYNATIGGDLNPVIGSTLPKFLGSLRNTFNYKSVSLSIFLDAKFGGDVYSNTYNYGSQYGQIKSTLYGRTAALGGLTYNSNTSYNGQTPGTRDDGMLPTGVFGPNTNVPASASGDGASHDVSGMTVADAYAKKYIKPESASDYYNFTYGWSAGLRSMSVFTSSWVSVREVALSYDIPPAAISKLKINSLRVSLVARNLFFLYNNAPDHVNPDNLSSTSSGAFIENGGTPYFRNLGVQVNASF